MASRNTAALLALAESIADGAAVDWAAAEAQLTDEDQAVIRQLRILSDLAALHRSLPASDLPDAPAASGRTAAASAAPALRIARPTIGTWAHLQLIERLGGGTFGDVYRAWDRHLEREVALKLLRGDEALGDLRASRIALEGRLVARVRHPNVITVHGVDVHDRRVGLWMEFVRGVTLEQQLAAHGPLSAREATLVGIDLCGALAAIHAAGLIHRDVKAQNVMREEGGRIVLMDLGTSREAGALGHGSSDLAGTPLYLAPEIFAGAAASERTDLYALGVLLYHIVTGSFPVRATTIQELHDGHKHHRAVRLRDARPDLPPGFVRVVERAIAGDPDDRYPTAGAFEADLVESLENATPAAARVTNAAPALPPVADGDGAAARRLTRSGAGIMLATLAVVLALVAIVWPALSRRTVPAVASGTIRSIAVLPLANMSGDPSQEYFADGMTDQVIGTLGELAGLNVISRTSAMQFKGTKKPLPEIARALNVDAVLEGAVLVLPGAGAGNPGDAKRVRITARLIYAGTDTQLWDRTFERIGADVLALQGEVARAVADGINLHLTSQQQRALARSARGSAQQFDAFDLYLKGRYYWNARTEEGLKRSIQYFQEAIELNPRFALGYAGLADAHSLLGYYGFVPRTEAHARAAAATSKALELDDSLAEPHASLAFLHEDLFEWQAAEAEHKRALALKPGYATGHHWYAYDLAQRGRFPEALNEIKTAMALDPLSVAVNGAYGAILLYARQYDEAIAQLERAIDMDPSFARNREQLATACLLKGLTARAIAETDRTEALGVRDAIVQSDIGYLRAMTGRRAAARAVLGDLVQRYRKHDDGTAFGIALVYAGLGERTEALDWLETAARSLDKEPELSGLKVDPRLDGLRADPRFGKLLATVGLAQ